MASAPTLDPAEGRLLRSEFSVVAEAVARMDCPRHDPEPARTPLPSAPGAGLAPGAVQALVLERQRALDPTLIAFLHLDLLDAPMDLLEPPDVQVQFGQREDHQKGMLFRVVVPSLDRSWTIWRSRAAIELWFQNVTRDPLCAAHLLPPPLAPPLLRLARFEGPRSPAARRQALQVRMRDGEHLAAFLDRSLKRHPNPFRCGDCLRFFDFLPNLVRTPVEGAGESWLAGSWVRFTREYETASRDDKEHVEDDEEDDEEDEEGDEGAVDEFAVLDTTLPASGFLGRERLGEDVHDERERGPRDEEEEEGQREEREEHGESELESREAGRYASAPSPPSAGSPPCPVPGPATPPPETSPNAVQLRDGPLAAPNMRWRSEPGTVFLRLRPSFLLPLAEPTSWAGGIASVPAVLGSDGFDSPPPRLPSAEPPTVRLPPLPFTPAGSSGTALIPRLLSADEGSLRPPHAVLLSAPLKAEGTGSVLTSGTPAHANETSAPSPLPRLGSPSEGPESVTSRFSWAASCADSRGSDHSIASCGSSGPSTRSSASTLSSASMSSSSSASSSSSSTSSSTSSSSSLDDSSADSVWPPRASAATNAAPTPSTAPRVRASGPRSVRFSLPDEDSDDAGLARSPSFPSSMLSSWSLVPARAPSSQNPVPRTDGASAAAASSPPSLARAAIERAVTPRFVETERAEDTAQAFALLRAVSTLREGVACRLVFPTAAASASEIGCWSWCTSRAARAQAGRGAVWLRSGPAGANSSGFQDPLPRLTRRVESMLRRGVDWSGDATTDVWPHSVLCVGPATRASTWTQLRLASILSVTPGSAVDSGLCSSCIATHEPVLSLTITNAEVEVVVLEFEDACSRNEVIAFVRDLVAIVRGDRSPFGSLPLLRDPTSPVGLAPTWR